MDQSEAKITYFFIMDNTDNNTGAVLVPAHPLVENATNNNT